MDRYHFLYICGMKNVFLIIFLGLLPFKFTEAQTSEFHWKPIDKSFDSIVNLLEEGFILDDNIRHRDTLMNQLYTLAKSHPLQPVYQWRTVFWDARSQLKKNKADSTVRLINKAYRLVDSVNYSYDYHRIFHLWTIMQKEKPHLIYKNLKNISEYYAKTNDLFMLAHAYIDMGNILSRLKDYPKALEYFQKADSYYRILNEDIYQAKNQLNISNVLYLMDEKKHADEILKTLLKNPVCTKDTAFHINTLLSLAEHDISLNHEIVSKAYRLSVAFANRGLLIRTETFMGDFFRSRNRPDSALYFYKNASQRIDNRHIDLLIPLLKNMSICFSALHRPDSAYSYLDKYEQYQDSLDQINSLAEIRRMESRTIIEKQELELKQAAERARFHFTLTLLICISIVSIAMLICYIFWKRHREGKIKQQLKELENKELTMRLENEALQNNFFKIELESKQRELASNYLIILQKIQMLKSLLEIIEKEEETGNIHHSTATLIGNTIKMELNTEDKWDFFKIQFEKVHPDFFTRLKARYPALTEGELRFCAYIRTGIENKLIAQMLSLQPDSIKKTRYRIRKKLELEQGYSLEDFLRNI